MHPLLKKILDPLLKGLKENLNKGYQKVDKLLLNILREVFVSLNSSFYLFIYFFTLIDDNECSTNGGLGPCEHICVNSYLSYQCLCKAGYTLNADGKTCAGELLILTRSPEAITCCRKLAKERSHFSFKREKSKFCKMPDPRHVHN